MIFTLYRTSHKETNNIYRDFHYSASLSHLNKKIYLYSEQFDQCLISPQVANTNEINVLSFTLGDNTERIEYLNNPFTMLEQREQTSTLTKYPMAKAYVDNYVCEIFRCYEKYKGKLCYWYFEMEVDGHSYKIYDSNHGYKGRYFCIYMDDALVAIAVFYYDKVGKEVTYTVYGEDDIDARLLAVLLIYNDTMLIFDDDVPYVPFAFIPKPLKQKYVPEFLDRIAMQEEKKKQNRWIDGIDFA